MRSCVRQTISLWLDGANGESAVPVADASVRGGGNGGVVGCGLQPSGVVPILFQLLLD